MRRLTIAVAVCAGAMWGAAGAQEHQHAGQFGTVNFANSCSAEAQPAFARAMALLHSFEFGAAIDAFGEVAKADPSCGIAVWGIALAQWSNPFSPANRPARQLQAGRESAERAAQMGAKTDRERAFIAAVSALYDRYETVDQRTRVGAYRDTMGRLVAAFPDDPEAKAFYAVALAAAADPADKTYADQLKAGAMMETLWGAQPDHPGFAHYIIHSYDVPALAPKALAAARRYAAIAPDAPHALHMPSHTFTRLGYWQDSIETNILSAKAAEKNGQIYEQLHATDYEVYAYLQTGQDAKARALVDEAPRIAAHVNSTAGAAPPVAGGYALAAIPARYALERGAWAEAAQLQPVPDSAPYVEAMTWFARALGAARSGATAEAHKNIAMIQAAAEKLAKAKELYWYEQVEIQKELAQAWTVFAEGRQQLAMTTMNEVTAREDRTEKNAISPGPLAPAHELFGEMLLEMKLPKAALAQFRKSIAKEPNRFRGIAGAAAAAAQAGDAVAARAYQKQLVAICANGDTPGRPELEAARKAR
jgi:hypothetical protein